MFFFFGREISLFFPRKNTHTKIICTKFKKIRIKKGPHTLSCSVMESCWLVGARIRAPVADLSPSFAKELWVVNHEYLLNGSVFTFSSIPHHYQMVTNPFITCKNQNQNWKLKSSIFTLEIGLMGFILVHFGTKFPSATQVSQCNPESQSLFLMHFCPSWKLQRKQCMIKGWCLF